MEGVMGYYDHEDVPGENEWGAVIKDEEIFASKLVTCIGQQIGIIAAETEAQARSFSPFFVTLFLMFRIIAAKKDALFGWIGPHEPNPTRMPQISVAHPIFS
jgi:xanthine dehydrogenase molybdopterin-binding subunit B